jgi:hypothetical protein
MQRMSRVREPVPGQAVPGQSLPDRIVPKPGRVCISNSAGLDTLRYTTQTTLWKLHVACRQTDREGNPARVDALTTYNRGKLFRFQQEAA